MVENGLEGVHHKNTSQKISNEDLSKILLTSSFSFRDTCFTDARTIFKTNIWLLFNQSLLASK